MEEKTALVYLSNAKQQIEMAKDIHEVKIIRNKAITLQELAQRQKMGLKMQNDLAEIRLYAERRAGEILKETELNNGGRPTEENPFPEDRGLPTLKDMGISWKESSNWQRIANIPEDLFIKHIEETKDDERELTTIDILKVARKLELKEEIKETIPFPEGVFDVILADPPWRYEHPISISRQIEQNYPTMDMENIKLLSPPFHENAILFLWCPAPMLKHGLDIMESWGFTFRTNAIWDKTSIGPGYWFRTQHEHLLVGIKGDFHPPDAKLRYSSVYQEKRTEHSKKPLFYYDMVEKMYPDGKYLELFGRGIKRKNWTAWGNEIIKEEGDGN